MINYSGEKSQLSVIHSGGKKRSNIKSESMEIFWVSIFPVSVFTISDHDQFLQFLCSACFN